MARFKIESESGNARAGVLKTVHGEIKTPFFMPVATKGSVKLLSVEEVELTKTRCLISNAFILSIKPGLDVIEKHNGLHKFMNWKKGLFTDSGGFQVLSDAFCLKLKDEGVLFRNPFTGKKMLFSPEKSIEIQNQLSSDVAMCLDDVPKAGAKIERIGEAVERTAEWAKKCKETHENKKQLLFGICQGGTSKKLRKKSAEQISEIGFDGHAIGGLAIGEPLSKMLETVEFTLPFIPKEKPRYLMGVGSVEELVKSIEMGIDCFDSVFPARTGRHGKVFTNAGHFNIGSVVHRFDLKPLDENCECFVCKSHTRSYIHHLFKTKEENAKKYITFHNLFFVQSMMDKIREEISEGNFSAKSFLEKMKKGDL
ncbi:MAG: tRNA guanosine(34) transglycosylase Tgt [Candidatus Diapherotrites archaeon]